MFHNLHEFQAPPATSDGKHRVSGDLTVRDYFAAKALNGLLSAELNAWRSGVETYDEYLEDLTSSAYLMADAMMEARK